MGLAQARGPLPDPSLLQRPFGSTLRAGVLQAFSSDFPCGSNAPLLGIAAAVTRTSWAGQLVAPAEAVKAEEALEAYTLGAARAAGVERECGSLEAGKRADLLVLSADPVECAPSEISHIRVEETWLKGVRQRNAP
jgi:predicted amidohydrolase YtcJ